MRTIEAIEENSHTLFGRFIRLLRAQGRVDPMLRVDAADVKNADWPVERPDCGGYNEAFVMQQWASFAPRDQASRVK